MKFSLGESNIIIERIPVFQGKFLFYKSFLISGFITFRLLRLISYRLEWKFIWIQKANAISRELLIS